MNNSSNIIQKTIVSDFMKKTKMEPRKTVEEIMLFLSSPESVNSMIEATKRGKPALVGVVDELEKRFANGDFPLNFDGEYANMVNRQNIGRMIKFIMSEFGYVPEKMGRCGLPNGENANYIGKKGRYFGSAAIYNKKTESAKYTINVEFDMR